MKKDREEFQEDHWSYILKRNARFLKLCAGYSSDFTMMFRFFAASLFGDVCFHLFSSGTV